MLVVHAPLNTHTCTHTHIQMHTYVHTNIHTQTHMHTCRHIYVHIHTHTLACTLTQLKLDLSPNMDLLSLNSARGPKSVEIPILKGDQLGNEVVIRTVGVKVRSVCCHAHQGAMKFLVCMKLIE